MLKNNRPECPACDGGAELAHTGEPYHVHSAQQEQRIRGLNEAIAQALRMAAVYTLEDDHIIDGADQRVTACLEQVAAYRLSIAAIRAGMRLQPGEVLARCVACRGLALADIECEGCGHPVDLDSLDSEVLDDVDVLVHRGCESGHGYFDHERATPRGENYFGSAEMRSWR